MTYPTPAQRDLIRRLSGTSVEMAAQDYGFAPGHSLSVRDASEIIDSLRAPAAPIMSESEIESAQKARFAAEAAARAAEIARHQAAAADTARIDAILVERGLGHLAGADRREARRLIRRELEA